MNLYLLINKSKELFTKKIYNQLIYIKVHKQLNNYFHIIFYKIYFEVIKIKY